MGAIGCFSFFFFFFSSARKLSDGRSGGNGGMIVTNDESSAHKCGFFEATIRRKEDIDDIPLSVVSFASIRCRPQFCL